MRSRIVIVALIIIGMAVAVAASGPAGQAAAGQAPPAGQEPSAPCSPSTAGSTNVAKDSRCFEMRTYTVDSGSSLDLLHKRFREYTMALFKKHGITIVGFWQPTNVPNALIYLCVYKDREARDKAWAAFNADPEWARVRKELSVSPKVDAVFMVATDYSPMK